MKERNFWLLALLVILSCFAVSRCHGQPLSHLQMNNALNRVGPPFNFPVPENEYLKKQGARSGERGEEVAPHALIPPHAPPPKPPGAGRVLKGAEAQRKLLAAAVVPPATVTLLWEWRDWQGVNIPMPDPGAVFQVLSTIDMRIPLSDWPVRAVTDRSPCTLTKLAGNEFFRVRASYPQTGMTSDTFLWRKQ